MEHQKVMISFNYGNGIQKSDEKLVLWDNKLLDQWNELEFHQCTNCFKVKTISKLKYGGFTMVTDVFKHASDIGRISQLCKWVDLFWKRIILKVGYHEFFRASEIRYFCVTPFYHWLHYQNHLNHHYGPETEFNAFPNSICKRLRWINWAMKIVFYLKAVID